MKRKLPIAQMNVVPYIDVMLVLLVIFMITAPLVQTTTIDLPKSSSPAKTDAQLFDVQVNWLGGEQFQWSTPDGQTQTMQGAPSLYQAINALLAQKLNEQKPLIVFGANQEAPYGQVIDRVDALRAAFPQAQIQLLMKKRSY